MTNAETNFSLPLAAPPPVLEIPTFLAAVAVSTDWTQEDAVRLCRLIEAFAPFYGAHVALTGGCLYRAGVRKDCDVMLYRHRERKEPVDFAGLFNELETFDVWIVADYGWCKKAKWGDKPFDIFDPDAEGEYPNEEAEQKS